LLERWLQDHLPGFARLARIEQFRGGQSNPTFRLTAEGGAQYVLRKKPAGALLPSAHAVDREFRVISALHGSAVPVARALCLCRDEGVIGTMFYVMEYVSGRNFWDATFPGMTPPERAALYDEMNRVMAALHTLDYAAAGLSDYGKPGNYFARQIARWSGQYRASETERIEAMEKLLTWLPANIPAGEETALVHGDYRHVMLWRLPAGEGGGLQGLDLLTLGIPTESEYVAAYCARTSRPPIEPRVWEFCMAYNVFRIACIQQGIMKRVLEGTAASRHAREAGGKARATAEFAWGQVERHLGG